MKVRACLDLGCYFKTLDVQAAAVHCIGKVAKFTGSYFGMYTTPALATLEGMLTFFGDDVRKNVVRALEEVVCAVFAAHPPLERGDGTCVLQTHTVEVLARVSQSMCLVMRTDGVKEVCGNRVVLQRVSLSSRCVRGRVPQCVARCCDAFTAWVGVLGAVALEPAIDELTTSLRLLFEGRTVHVGSALAASTHRDTAPRRRASTPSRTTRATWTSTMRP